MLKLITHTELRPIVVLLLKQWGTVPRQFLQQFLKHGVEDELDIVILRKAYEQHLDLFAITLSNLLVKKPTEISENSANSNSSNETIKMMEKLKEIIGSSEVLFARFIDFCCLPEHNSGDTSNRGTHWLMSLLQIQGQSYQV